MSAHPNTASAPETLAPTTRPRSRRLAQLLKAVKGDDYDAIRGSGIDESTVEREPNLADDVDVALALAVQLGHRRALRALVMVGADPLSERVMHEALNGATPPTIRVLAKSARTCHSRAPTPGVCGYPRDLSDGRPLGSFDTKRFLFELCSGDPEPHRRHASLRLLLAAGADPNATDSFLEEPLSMPEVVTEGPHPDDDQNDDEDEWNVSNAVASRITPDSELAHDSTPLHYLAVAGDKEGTRLLLDAGARVDARDAFRGTPLHAAARSKHPIDPRLVLELRKAGADVDAVDRYDRTPLRLAAQLGNLRVAYALIKAGADVDARDRDGATALMHAVTGKDPQTLVDALVRKGADINARDALGRTPLIRVAQAGRGDLVELLLAHGADRHARDHTDTDAFTHLWASRDKS